MLRIKTTLKEEPQSSLNASVKFMRRPELTTRLRFVIAVTAVMGLQSANKITKIAKRFNVSPAFVYDMRSRLLAGIETIFGVGASVSVPQSCACLNDEISAVLMLRLRGSCSIGAISELLSRFDFDHTSTGFVSGVLTAAGESVSDTIDWSGKCVLTTDELYCDGHCPILVSVEPVSGAILHISKNESLTKESWVKHYAELREQGIEPSKIISDDGHTMRAARKHSYPDVAWQPDTFHAVAHRLGEFLNRFRRKAEAAIAYEYDRENLVKNGRAGESAVKRHAEYLDAQQKSREAILAYDNFSFLYACMLRQFTVFDTRTGAVRSRSFAEAEMKAACELMRLLNDEALNKELAQIERLLPELFAFLQTAQQGAAELATQVAPEVLPFWLTAWQNAKTAAKIKGKPALKKKFLKKTAEDLILLKQSYTLSDQTFEEKQFEIFAFLDNACAQSSSAVENANAFIRKYLNNSRDQISQPALNLLMFYWNHRRFERGKRKGKAPVEILSGKNLEKDWLDLMAEKMRNK